MTLDWTRNTFIFYSKVELTLKKVFFCIKVKVKLIFGSFTVGFNEKLNTKVQKKGKDFRRH